MLVQQILDQLEASADAALRFLLPDGTLVPAHFHVTEVGRVEKRFIDCGGTEREAVSCLLQVWTADDYDHRLGSQKLAAILRLAGPLLKTTDLPVEVEYGPEVAAQYRLADIATTSQGLLFVLEGKQTDCLAPDRCGISGCGPSSGCC